MRVTRQGSLIDACNVHTRPLRTRLPERQTRTATRGQRSSFPSEVNHRVQIWTFTPRLTFEKAPDAPSRSPLVRPSRFFSIAASRHLGRYWRFGLQHCLLKRWVVQQFRSSSCPEVVPTASIAGSRLPPESRKSFILLRRATFKSYSAHHCFKGPTRRHG
jgi:hypothetical protein